MKAAIVGAAKVSRHHLEDSLLPVKGTTIEKTACYIFKFFKFLVALPAAAVSSLAAAVVLSRSSSQETPLVEFAKHPEWESESQTPPIKIGAASCDFQENGPQEHPNTNWAQFYQEKRIAVPHAPDIWNHPERVLEKLVELRVDSFRFSVARDKIEQSPGKFDRLAIDHYISFVKMLKAQNIEPMVTLSHFAEPLYFSWERREDIKGFVEFAKAIVGPLYHAGVRKIVTINEPTVIAFQGYVRGEFPPEHRADFEGAARVLENMARAHRETYYTLKDEFKDLEIGLSQDPIRFRHFHKFNPLWTPLEQIVCHYLTELNHTAFYKLLQTGKFSLKVPFCTDYQFQLGQPPPLDFIGLQYYTDPLLQFSFTGGKSTTRIEEEKLTSYDYRAYPQGLASALEEFSQLRNPQGQPLPIDITEIGIDIGINKDDRDAERIQYYDRLFQVIKKAIEQKINVRSAYFWAGTGDNLEWPKAFKVRFGLYSFDPETGESAPRPAAHWLRQKLEQRSISRLISLSSGL